MVQTAADYHISTCYDRYDMKGHFMDWENEPDVYKIYSGMESVPLSKVSGFPKCTLWELVKKQNDPIKSAALDADRLAQIFSLSHSITARSRHGGQYTCFRSAASAGALYPNEMYLAAYGVDRLAPGVYAYDIKNLSLTLLRKGNFGQLTAAATGCRGASHLTATFFITAIFFRSAWKYRVRAYRYVLLDAGHLIENIRLALSVFDLGFTIHGHFDDVKLGNLIGLDIRKEACLACVNVKDVLSTWSGPDSPVTKLPDEIIDASRVSKREIPYEAIQQIHQSGIGDAYDPEIQPHVQVDMLQQIGIVANKWFPIQKPDKEDESVLGYPEAVLYRRSRRNYVNEVLSQKKLWRLLDLVCRESIPNVSWERGGLSSLATGFLAGNVEGLSRGFYLLNPQQGEFGLVYEDAVIERMTPVCLNQEWLCNASLHFLFMTNLSVLDECCGARGYRYAMLKAGCLGQAIYIGATALGLGCCGIGAFYDHEAKTLLGLNDASFLLYLVAVGSVRRF